MRSGLEALIWQYGAPHVDPVDLATWRNIGGKGDWAPMLFPIRSRK
jgi:hypothetical protein